MTRMICSYSVIFHLTLSLSTAVHRIEQCIDELKDWMTAKLPKSEILPVIPRQRTGLAHGRVRVGSDYVTAVRHVKNLGVYLDSHLDMTTQVSRTISSSFHMPNSSLSLNGSALITSSNATNISQQYQQTPTIADLYAPSSP